MQLILKVLVTVSVASLPLFAIAASSAPPFDPAQAAQAYLDSLGRDTLERSNAYFEGGYWLQLWGFLYGVAIAWLLLNTRLSAWMRDQAARVGKIRLLHDILYLVQYFIITAILGFPLALYEGYFREHAYGLSNLSLAGWLEEEFKGLLIGTLLGALAFAAIYTVIRRFHQNWAILGSVVGIAFLAFFIMISPVFVTPLFNDYTALEEGPLKEGILSLARANGIPVDNVYQFDASKQSNRISANVSGLLGTTRISLNDNLLNRSSPATVKAVMAHEMGHYVLGHSTKLLLSFGLVLAGGFAFMRWGFDRFNRARWGVRDVGDIAGLPLLMILFSSYMFALTPLTNSIVRSNETEADIFGINASREPEGFALGILSLSEYRKMKPGFWEEILFFDHPSGYNRIYSAMRWRQENLPPPAGLPLPTGLPPSTGQGTQQP